MLNKGNILTNLCLLFSYINPFYTLERWNHAVSERILKLSRRHIFRRHIFLNIKFISLNLLLCHV